MKSPPEAGGAAVAPVLVTQAFQPNGLNPGAGEGICSSIRGGCTVTTKPSRTQESALGADSPILKSCRERAGDVPPAASEPVPKTPGQASGLEPSPLREGRRGGSPDPQGQLSASPPLHGDQAPVPILILTASASAFSLDTLPPATTDSKAVTQRCLSGKLGASK